MIIWNSFLAGTFFVFLLQGLVKGFPWYHALLMGFVFGYSLTDAIIEYKRRIK
jgi:hypothetical protein